MSCPCTHFYLLITYLLHIWLAAKNLTINLLIFHFRNDSYQYDSESDFKRSMQSSQSDFKMPLDDDSEYGPDYSDEDDDDKYYDDEDDEDEYGPDDDVHYTDDPIYDDPDPQGAVGGVAIAGHPRGDRKDPMDSFV